MPIDAAALALFAFATSITPGPNNLMLMASGARFGLRRTVPHMLGVSVGFATLAISVGFGLAEVLERAPALETLMKALSATFILYLAWKIATAENVGSKEQAAQPLSFLAGWLFQWINPKTWAMALTAMTLYTQPAAPGGASSVLAILAVAAVFSAVNLPCVGVWAAAGGRVSVILDDPARRRLFHRAMAALLVVSTLPLIL